MLPFMEWILLSIVSALLLGVYDAAKKLSVHDNAVPMVLLGCVSIGALLYTPIVLWSMIAPETIPFDAFRLQSLSRERHGLLLFAKSVLVGASWTLAFSALKELPLSIAAPIRATSPAWTILVAILFFGERPTALQWVGVCIVLIGFWRFTMVGRREGVDFVGNRSVLLMIGATLLGAASSIYDKWLLQYAAFHPATLQAWFTIYLVPVMVPLAVHWRRSRVRAAEDSSGSSQDERSGKVTSKPFDRRRANAAVATRFQWRKSMLFVSPLLIAADWFYFVALSDPEAMIAVVSVVRRCSVVVALVFAAKKLSETNFRAKLECVVIILVGVALLTSQG